MNMQEFLDYLRQGKCVAGGSDLHELMHQLAQEAMRITATLNNRCHEQEEIRRLFSKLTGRPVPETFSMFPPFYTECGKNIFIGENVLSTAAAIFKTTAVFISGTGRSSGLML